MGLWRRYEFRKMYKDVYVPLLIMAGINFKAKSLLAFLTAISFVAWIGALYFKSKSPEVAADIISLVRPVFILCFMVWLVFIGLSIYRNIKK